MTLSQTVQRWQDPTTKRLGEPALVPDEPRWSLPRAARDVGISLTTVRKLCQTGQIPHLARRVRQVTFYTLTAEGLAALRQLVPQELVLPKGYRRCLVCHQQFPVNRRVVTCSEKCRQERRQQQCVAYKYQRKRYRKCRNCHRKFVVVNEEPVPLCSPKCQQQWQDRQTAAYERRHSGECSICDQKIIIVPGARRPMVCASKECIQLFYNR